MTRRAWWLFAALIVVCALWSRGGEPLYRLSWTEAALFLGGSVCGHLLALRALRAKVRAKVHRCRECGIELDPNPRIVQLGGGALVKTGLCFPCEREQYPEWYDDGGGAE